MLHHAHVRVHPPVHVALQGNHDFGRIESAPRRHSRARLADIEATVFGGDRLDVVKQRVAVGDFQSLAHHHPHHSRRVEASVLVDGCGFTRLRIRPVGQSAHDADEHICQFAVRHHHDRVRGSVAVFDRAIRFLCHVDRRVRWHAAGKTDYTRDAAVTQRRGGGCGITAPTRSSVTTTTREKREQARGYPKTSHLSSHIENDSMPCVPIAGRARLSRIQVLQTTQQQRLVPQTHEAVSAHPNRSHTRH